MSFTSLFYGAGIAGLTFAAAVFSAACGVFAVVLSIFRRGIPSAALFACSVVFGFLFLILLFLMGGIR